MLFNTYYVSLRPWKFLVIFLRCNFIFIRYYQWPFTSRARERLCKMEHFCRLVGHNGMKYILFFSYTCVFARYQWRSAMIKLIFHFDSNLPKYVPNHYPEHLLFWWIVLRIVIWHIFWMIEQKWKSDIKPPYSTK